MQDILLYFSRVKGKPDIINGRIIFLVCPWLTDPGMYESFPNAALSIVVYAFLSFAGKKVSFYQAPPNKETKNVTGMSEKGKIQQK